ncbi:MAG: tetratricopeptide repeat protein [Pseudomonadota bacterium]
MRKLTLALCALALAGCGGSDAFTEGTGTSELTGSDAFLALMKEAREASEDGDFADTGRLLDEARAIEPENPGVWVAIARLRFRGGEHIKALDAAQYAFELGPTYAPAVLLRAQLVRDAHGLTDSLPWFEAAVEADPNNTEILGEYAATLGDAGYYAQMLEVTRALTDIAPEDPRALFLKAALAARGGKPVLAKSLIERSGLVEEGVPSALMLDALIDLSERSYDSAAETLEALAQKQPGNGRVAELLARALWLGGRDDELVGRFAEAARREDASPYLIMLVGRALERSGDRSGAAPYLERALQGRPGGWVALSPNANLPDATATMRRHIAAQRLRQARREAARLQRRFAGSSDVAALSGDAALASGDFDGALKLYRKAAQVRRPWPLTRKAVAAYRDFGDPLAADVLLARHLVSEPRNTEALLLYAERAARAQDWLRVEVLLDNAIELGAGNDPRLLKLRGIAARAQGKDAEAREFERMTWDLHPVSFHRGKPRHLMRRRAGRAACLRVLNPWLIR